MQDLLYLDDLMPGQRFESASHALDTDQIRQFATEYDPQPFHLDEMAATDTVFRGLAASGWHVAALTMRLLVTGGLPIACGIVGAGAELDWPMPTRPGDTLRTISEVVDVRPSRSKPDRGIATVKVETRNQDGDVVLALTVKLLVFRRSAEA